MFKYLIDNIYVKFRGSIFKQIVGIPMGCDCAPQVADLFLYWYEHDYISKGVLVDDPAIHLLKHASRYIDDLNVPDIDSSICESICYDIYPDELDIVPTNTSFSNTTFLDLDISVIDGEFISKLYDKRRDFGFKVITFPKLRSNIPNKTSYGTFIGELYRTCLLVNPRRDMRTLYVMLSYHTYKIKMCVCVCVWGLKGENLEFVTS